MTEYRLIAIDKSKVGTRESNLKPESFLVDCQGDLESFMNEWEKRNGNYKALHITKYIDKNTYTKTSGNHW